MIPVDALLKRRDGQVVRHRFAKPTFAGSIPAPASISFNFLDGFFVCWPLGCSLVKQFAIYLSLILGAVIICVLVIDREEVVTASGVVELAEPVKKESIEDGVVGTIVWDSVVGFEQNDSRGADAIPPAKVTVDRPVRDRTPAPDTQPKEDYYSSVVELDGEALKAGLHRLVRGHRALAYGELWDALTYLDTAGAGKVMLIYSRVSRLASNHGGDYGEWNREHLWPRAYGISKSSPANTDLHHIRASDVKVNADRGHLYFDETEGESTAGVRYSADKDSWEPPREVKGDIARALFYMAIRYEGNEPNEVDLELTDTPDISKRHHGKLSVLLDWHRLDPVSPEEITRNTKIFRNYQGNRNPFIDHPEFAIRVFSR